MKYSALFIWLICVGRREYCEPALLKNNPCLLVVDGFLNSSPESTYIKLTYTRNLRDTVIDSIVLRIMCIDVKTYVGGILFPGYAVNRGCLFEGNIVSLVFRTIGIPLALRGDLAVYNLPDFKESTKPGCRASIPFVRRA